MDRRRIDREVRLGGILEPVLDLFALDYLAEHQRARGWIFLGLIGEAVFMHRAVLRVFPIILGDQERTVKQTRCVDGLNNEPARWRLRNDRSAEHMVENLSQTVTFAFDPSGPELTLGLYLSPSGKVVDDEKSELPIAIETDRAHLDGYPLSIPAPQCALHLRRGRPLGHNGFH